MSRYDLTDAEREELGIFDNGTYSCACRGEVCESIPCRNDRNDLLTTVERILTARLAAVEAERDFHIGWVTCRDMGIIATEWEERAKKAESERDRLAAAVERVEALMAGPEWHIEVALGGSHHVNDQLRAALSDAGGEVMVCGDHPAPCNHDPAHRKRDDQ